MRSSEEDVPMSSPHEEEEEDQIPEEDVAKFDGKIVYNPDGSAYILEDDNLDILLPKQDGSIIDRPGGSPLDNIPPIANAFYVSKGNLYNALLKNNSCHLSGLSASNAPVVHSYRVYSPRGDVPTPVASTKVVPLSLLSVPVKPILMCFLCKLSFGCTKSFSNHGVSEHGICLNKEEASILTSKHSSAIIQTYGRDREALISFLEPVTPEKAPEERPPSAKSTSEEQQTLIPQRITPEPESSIRKSPPSAGSISPASFPTNANMLQGTTIGACPEHVNGRPTGLECPKCDLILNASRLPGGIAWNTSRNSCKTLKCPKCNWHYKYQETLEIHMKEKHPENETTCIYCISGQQHPRLARGETYTCGYKPYRCEVCNYSTTTKGNLSIHMQSDKHLNNMQELQNGESNAAAASNNNNRSPGPGSPQVNHPPPPPTHSSPAHKPNWRCDICNYETNVARNLRIHMTSEKHSQNVLALQQQNAKSFSSQQSSAMGDHKHQQQQQLLQGFGLLAAAAASSNPDANAMADLAYNQALISQLIQQQQHQQTAFVQAEIPPEASEADPNPRSLFSCCVCRDFGCDSLEPLSGHLSLDRSKSRENEVSMVIGGNYLCQLCSYKTNLKANFQLHCKTDKHLQRLNHVNHIKEGGPSNEWKLRFLSNVNPVELRCNACDFFTNSPHKLQVHASGGTHQIAAILFSHLVNSEERLSSSSASSSYLKGLLYECRLCSFSATGKAALLGHVRSMKHLQMEQIHQLQKRAEGNLSQTDIGEVFRVRSSESNLNTHQQQYPRNEEDNNNSDKTESKVEPCPLCSEKFSGQESLEQHASSVHSVNPEGIARLQSLINGSQWLQNDRKRLAESSQEEMEVDSKEELVKDISVPPQEASIPTPEKSPSKGSALEALLGNIRKEHPSEPEEAKPYKCNICKVSYASGSALDIHIRSLLHQSKASKLQELILGGQIDLSKPLIQQPEALSETSQGKKILSDMLSPKSLNSTGSSGSNPQSSPINANSHPPNSPLSSPLMAKEETPPESVSSVANLLKSFKGGNSSPVLQNLLSNSGLDLVLQLNEMQQKKSSIAASKAEDNEEPEEVPKAKGPSEDSSLIPCPVCKSGFPNTWSLKSHCEESHGDVLPGEILDKLIDKMKEENQSNNNNNNNNEDRSPQPSVRSSTPQCPPQNLMEMQEVLQRAMMSQMNPMMMQMAQLQGGLNPLAAMNLYPPLIPPGLLPPGGASGMIDPKVLALMAAKQNPEELKTLNPHAAFMQMLAQQQQQQQQSASNAKIPSMEHFGFPPTPPDPPSKSSTTANPPLQGGTPNNQGESGGKRARTRISDDQLKILRSHFDINNSPTEETLNLMASQTGLPLKVIKHWFRNTLFKERQKNKDSPYNFSNPPSTKLNLEEYEKSGETKITPLKPEEQGEYIQNELKKEVEEPKALRCASPAESHLSDHSSHKNTEIPSESNGGNLTLSRLLAAGGSPNLLPNFPPAFPGSPAGMPNYLSSLANRMSSDLSNTGPAPRPQSPQQSGSSGKRANRTRFTDYQIKVLQEFFENNAYPKDDDLEYLSKLLGLSPRVIVVWFQNARQKARKIYENQPAGNECSPVASHTSSSSASGAVGATVAGINVNISDSDSEQANAGRFTRTPGLNYQCKKCCLVFQRYYELIRHQKQHCYKEEDAKRSAQAQKAAGQAAAHYAGQIHNSEHSSSSHEMEEDVGEHGGVSYLSRDEEFENDSDSLYSTSSKRKLSDTELDAEELQNREKRLRTTITQEQLDFLHQKYEQDSNPDRKTLEMISEQVGLRKRVVQVWFQNTRALERKGLLEEIPSSVKCPLCPASFKSISSLEAHMASSHSEQRQPLEADRLEDSMRKYYEDTMKRFMNDIHSSEKEQQVQHVQGGALDLSSTEMDALSDNEDGGGNKRFRTQMTGLQVKMMKAVFESIKTPSMSECYTLGREIGLQKRVVQVWFQNARAKEKRSRLQSPSETSIPSPPAPNAAAPAAATTIANESPSGQETCRICSFQAGNSYSLQDHIFSKSHFDKLRSVLESGLYEPESPGHTPSGSVGEPLHMLQINNRDLLDMTSRTNPRLMMQV